MAIELKSPEEIEIMREAGRIVAQVLRMLVAAVRPGVVERDLDEIVRREYKARGATPTFLGYHGYPATVCVSINDEIVHGIPGDRVIREGDIVSLDLGATYRGFVGDSAITVGAGEVSEEKDRLIRVTEESLWKGIEAARPGARMGDVSWAIQEHAEQNGFSVVREYVGHGIGRAMHEEPQVPNFGAPHKGLELREGMVLALEPMLNTGDWRTKRDDDNWTVRTADGGLSAHFEHTIAITKDGPVVLTLP
ncbi:MAG: type I methionyl aminopeptidase [Dehalococcoidia bacterium]|nr:type I methionyl aminopeptidase [Dehalococcoidia bacterium]